MIVLPDLEQGTPEWMSARAGVISASNFSKIVTSTGSPSKGAGVENYLYELAAESIIGEKAETFQSDHMKRGIEMEEEARNYFMFSTGINVEQVGIVYKDESRHISCSPDGLIKTDEEYSAGIEIKCPMLKTHIKYLRDEKLPTEYIQQVQGSMYVTGLSHWWFMSYYPGVKPLLLKVARDDRFIMALHERLMSYVSELSSVKLELQEYCDG